MNKKQREFHRSRRELLRKLIGKDSLAIVFGSSHFNKSFDADFKFKQYKNFYYLTGFDEPDAAILISGHELQKEKTNEILFVRKNDPVHETWNGKRLSFEKVPSELGIKKALENSELAKFLLLRRNRELRRVYVNFSELMKLTGELKQIAAPFLEVLNIIASNVEIIDIAYLIGKMRAVKTGYEIEMIAKAADISVRAYYEAMKAIMPGKYEYEIQAELEYNYKVFGSEDNAYYPIVASGENGCILHYESNNCLLKNGEMLLIDSAGEHRYYCSDITRTFPVSGKFTEEQKIVYDIVLKANKECIKNCRPGKSIKKIGELSDRIIADGLHKAGILKNKKDVKKFTIHGIGHHIGLDTHDAVSYTKTASENNDALRAGNVLTIEPGVYFPYGSKDIAKKYHGIAVRIEDDILVTEKGPVNLTAHMVKEIDDIEAFMSSRI